MLLIYAISLFTLSNLAKQDLIAKAYSVSQDNTSLNLELGKLNLITISFNPEFYGEFNQDVIVPQAEYYQNEQDRLTQEAKEAEEKVIQESRSKQTTTTTPTVVYQGDFTTLYQQAGLMFNVPWQLLAAVHITESGQANTPGPVSYAGAVGPMQFMPSTFQAYAVDANGNGASVYEVEDAIYTAAKYLALGGADKGDFYTALYNYNHSNTYVAHVLAIASSLGL